MKKLLVGLILVLCLAVASIAGIGATISQEITTADYVAVRLPANANCESFAIWTEDGSGFYIASVVAGTDGVLVPEDTAISVHQQFSSTSSTGAIIFYAKGTTTTNLVGIITQ